MEQKNTIMRCMLFQIQNARIDIIFCHFRPFFAFLPHFWPQKLKFEKNVKKHLDILPFYTCVPLIKIIKLPMKFYSSKKNYCRCRKTMCSLCFCSQRVLETNFPAIWRHKIKKKFTLVPTLGALHVDSYLSKQ